MPPMPTDDYGHGQMMGMLVILQLFDNAFMTKTPIPDHVLNTIKSIAVGDLSVYLNKPQEDVYLLIEEQLRNIQT